MKSPSFRTLASLALASLASCAGGERGSGDSAATPGSVDLTGAGATFPYPIYSRWFSDYAARTGVRINYQSIGSGGGIKQLSEGTVDFGATDGPMTDEEMAAAKGGAVLHFPTVLGAVVVTYNVPGITAPLRVTGELLSGIFLGKVTRWNDPRMVAGNPGVALPAADIIVVHRSDGSGTTYIFTDYLTTVSGNWASGPGRGKSVSWPVGLGGRGNEGVAGQVKQTPGTIGYVELAYARQNRLPVAHVRNASGAFVEPTTESITAAAESAAARLGPGSDFRVSIVDAPGAGAYPVSSFTWLLVYRRQLDAAKAATLAEFMAWMYAEGQASAPSLDYAPLPSGLLAQLAARVTAFRADATR